MAQQQKRNAQGKFLKKADQAEVDRVDRYKGSEGTRAEQKRLINIVTFGFYRRDKEAEREDKKLAATASQQHEAG